MEGESPTLRLDNVASESDFVMKLAWADVALKISAAKLWSYNIFIMIMIIKFIFNFSNFCVIVFFVAKLLISGILLFKQNQSHQEFSFLILIIHTILSF